jgi:hypothetical protein
MSMMGFVIYFLEIICEGNYKPLLTLTLVFKTLILKIKHIYFLFLFKNYQHFLHKKLKNLKISTKFNEHEFIHERLLFFVDFLFTFSHMT